MSFLLIIPLILFFILIILMSIIPYWIYFILAVITAISSGHIFNIWTIVYFLLGMWAYNRKKTYKNTFHYKTNFDYSQFNSNFGDNFNDNFSYTTNTSDYIKACEYFGFTADTPYDEKKKIYKKFVFKYHPDINKEKNAEEKIKEINNYWDIIEKYGA